MTLYRVFVRAPDGRHEITEKALPIEDATAVANDWLGPVATWTTPTRAVCMFGSVLTIEEEEDDQDA